MRIVFFIVFQIIFQDFGFTKPITTQQSDSLLHKAVLNEDLKQMKKLLEKGFDVMQLYKGETALMFACKTQKPNMDVVNLLLDYNIDIFFENPETSNSALEYCIKLHHNNVIELFLNRVSSKKELYNHHFLSYSIACDNYEAFTLLFPFFKKKVENFDFSKLLIEALDHACFSENLISISYYWPEKENIDTLSAINIFQYLTSNGVDVNIKYKDKSTLFKAACSPRMMQLLLQSEFDVTQKFLIHGITTQTALEYYLDRVLYKHKIVVIGDTISLTDSIEFSRELKIIDKMVVKGATLSNGYKDPYFYILIQLIEQKDLGRIKVLLLHKNINLSQTTLDGRSVLMLTEEIGNQAIFDLLQENGAIY